MSMESILVALAFALVHVHCEEINVKLWEGGSRKISCHDDQKILILSADYGRTERNCHSSNALQITKKECDSFSSCTLYATNAEFGDPCRGIRKYLTVSYNCAGRSLSPWKTVRVCERQKQTIECPYAHMIDVDTANYGRLTRNVCPGSIRSTECKAQNSLSTVKTDCQGKQSCALEANNAKFGDPCVGTYKYLEVSYRCASIESNALERVRICEGSQQSIQCSGGRKITLTYANYGRFKGSHVCGGPVRTTKCEAENSLSVVLEDCQDKTECVLQANNGKFGDPCVGTKKYLEVHYRCKDDAFQFENQPCGDAQ